MNEVEQTLRVELAACYRIFDMLGWSELIYNHITVKLPGDEEHFLINPYGLHYSEVTASNLVKVDVEGNVIDETPYKVNPAGMVIHSAIHKARPDLVCISHLHTTAGMAVACQPQGLRRDNFYSVLLHNQVAYHDFEGLTVLPEEQQRLVANLGNKCQLILRNHGLLSAGSSIAETFYNTWALQRACEVQVAADACGQGALAISETIADKSEALLNIQRGGAGVGELEFAAFKRKLDALGSDYQH